MPRNDSGRSKEFSFTPSQIPSDKYYGPKNDWKLGTPKHGSMSQSSKSLKDPRLSLASEEMANGN